MNAMNTTITVINHKEDAAVERMLSEATWAYAEQQRAFEHDKRSMYFHTMSGKLDGIMSCVEMFVANSREDIKAYIVDRARREYGIE